MSTIAGKDYCDFLADDDYWYPNEGLDRDRVFLEEEILKINDKEYDTNNTDVPAIKDNDRIVIVDGYVTGHEIALKTFFNRWRRKRDETYLILKGNKEAIELFKSQMSGLMSRLKIKAL